MRSRHATIYGEFFEFKPTHKLQLLTNHKPVIKGQDSGIWRRIMLIPFKASFDAAEGEADRVAIGTYGIRGSLRSWPLNEKAYWPGSWPVPWSGTRTG